MKQFFLGLSMAGVFILGCVGATVVQSTARAEAPVGVQRWEYTCPGVAARHVEKANAYGAEGWEMVSGDLCYKRPL